MIHSPGSLLSYGLDRRLGRYCCNLYLLLLPLLLALLLLLLVVLAAVAAAVLGLLVVLLLAKRAEPSVDSFRFAAWRGAKL